MDDLGVLVEQIVEVLDACARRAEGCRRMARTEHDVTQGDPVSRSLMLVSFFKTVKSSALKTSIESAKVRRKKLFRYSIWPKSW